jgi:hypothetical protein
MIKPWFVRFGQQNEYQTLPSYEMELNRARKALEDIQQY